MKTICRVIFFNYQIQLSKIPLMKSDRVKKISIFFFTWLLRPSLRASWMMDPMQSDVNDTKCQYDPFCREIRASLLGFTQISLAVGWLFLWTQKIPVWNPLSWETISSKTCFWCIFDIFSFSSQIRSEIIWCWWSALDRRFNKMIIFPSLLSPTSKGRLGNTQN